MEHLRLEEISTPEIDYGFLVSRLKAYKHPRGKINYLLKSGDLVRVKKGLYVKGRGAPYSIPLLANMIYGPSYVSQDYALSLYALIPERVEVVTSMTTGRRKHFRTPVGEFTYEPLAPQRYAVGIRRRALDDDRGFLIATPEKALVDRIWRVEGIQSTKQLDDYLEGDLRLELGMSHNLFSVARMREIARVYKTPVVDVLLELLIKRSQS